jgi:cell division protein FtsZ
MQGAGSALMGIGSARGDDRAVQASELAISSPLLEASIDGAHGVLLSIQGGSDLGLFEIHEAARLVQEAAHPEANIIFGAVIDDALGDEVRVTVIAAGFDNAAPGATNGPRGASAGRTELPTGAVRTAPAVIEPADDPVVEDVAAPRTAETEAVPTRVQQPVEVPPVVEEQPRRRPAADDLDIPDFLK